MTSTKRGPGFWKLNTRILADPNNCAVVKSEIRKEIDHCLQLNFTAKDTWERIKIKAKEKLQEISRTASSVKKLVISQLMEKIDLLECTIPLNKNDAKLLVASKKDLDTLMEEHIQGVIFRTKAQWYEDGEKNSQYFLNLERYKYQAKTCETLMHEGNLVTREDQIMLILEEFYRQLYEEDPNVCFDLKNTTDIFTPEAMKIRHEQRFSDKEVETAVKQLNKGKTPGKDGLPVEFYLTFWEEIKDVFIEMMNESFEEGKLCSSCSTGVLNLIPKTGRDIRLVKNLCPITLLNCDYKIMEKCVANRLSEVTEVVIHCNQKGFMPKRRISANIRKLLDTIHTYNEKDEPGVVLNLDLEKAFDKLSFQAIFGCMSYFNVAEYLINWVRVLYSDFVIQIQNNGSFSRSIPIQKRNASGRSLLNQNFCTSYGAACDRYQSKSGNIRVKNGRYI